MRPIARFAFVYADRFVYKVHENSAQEAFMKCVNWLLKFEPAKGSRAFRIQGSNSNLQNIRGPTRIDVCAVICVN